MKKLIAVLAVLMIVVCTIFTASADETTTVELTFRNGIKFGMTEQQVIDTETQDLLRQSFGEGQNPHVTVLTTEEFDISNGNVGTVQYLFWDVSMYAVLYNFVDGTMYDASVAESTALYGEPQVSSTEGIANWVEHVSGSRPELTGEQYVWDLGNNISLTVCQFGSRFINLFLDAN